jgi:hypothetical protein
MNFDLQKRPKKSLPTTPHQVSVRIANGKIYLVQGPASKDQSPHALLPTLDVPRRNRSATTTSPKVLLAESSGLSRDGRPLAQLEGCFRSVSQ